MCDSKSIKCSQDGKYYTGNRATGCCFNAAKPNSDTCENSFFNRSSCYTDNVSICPSGYTFKMPTDPCKDAKICGHAGGGGLSLAIWQLNNACVGDEPKMDENLKLLCCTGHPPGGDYYGNCATGYCPNNSMCAGVMSDYCVKNGLDPNCKNFFNVTNNTTSKRLVTQSMMAQWIKESPDPRQNKNINKMVALCNQFAPPGACDPQLRTFCTSLTRKELNANTDLKNLCGCFMAEKEYDEFKRILKDAGALPDVCDPLCASSQTQRGDRNCATDRCKSAICVVDLSNKDVQEVIQKNDAINQTCVTSKGGSSECYIAFTGMDRKEMRQKNVHVDQNCGQCFLYDPNKPYKEGVNPEPAVCGNLSGGPVSPPGILPITPVDGESPPDILPVTPVDGGESLFEKYKVQITIGVIMVLVLFLLLAAVVFF